MALNAAAGLQGMLKDGHTSLEGLDAATLRNITAAKELSHIVSTSLGPNGMNKLVVNHLERIIVTSDCATIVQELEIEHPAAKMLSLASKMQDEECGDGTNLTVSFAGQLLDKTEELLRSGLHTSEVIAGYRKAADRLYEILPALSHRSLAEGGTAGEMDEARLAEVIRPVLAAKQYGSEEFLAPLVAKACLSTSTRSSSSKVGVAIHPDSVRIAKVLGGSVGDSRVIHGFMALRGVETPVTSATDAKVAVFGCGVEASGTEAKGTVLMKTAQDLKGYNVSEENKMEEIIKSIADAGTKVIVSGGTVSEMAMHFIERYGMMCLKIGSRYELRRLCSAVGATGLVRLGPPTPDEMGYCDQVKVEEIGGRRVTVFRQNAEASGAGDSSRTHNDCRLSTILLRASTSNVLADLERAVDDGIHAARMVCKDGRLLPGAGACEMEASLRIRAFADSRPGLDQYAIRAFSSALEFVPRNLAKNAGLDPAVVLAGLSAAHTGGNVESGVDIEDEDGSGILTNNGVVDILATKESAFRLAIDAAITVLKVDQIIMSKPAGGGK